MTRLFCNDLCVIQALYPQGIPDDITIISESPNVNLEHQAISINDRCSPKQLVDLTRAIHFLCVSVYEKLKDTGYEADSYALMYALSCSQNFLKKAIFLNEDDFNEPAIVTTIEHSKKNPRVSNDYLTLLEDHTNCTIKILKPASIKIKDHFHTLQTKKKGNKATEYLKAFSLNVSSYPLVTPLWPFLKRLWPALSFIRKPSIALIEESQVIRWVCTRLSFSGYGFNFIKEKLFPVIELEKHLYKDDAKEQFTKVMGVIGDEITSFIASNVTKSAYDTTYQRLYSDLQKAHQQYYSAYRTSKKFIPERMENTRVVLSNMLKNPTEYGFALACRDHNIKIFTFQHGICREISPHFDYIPQITETNLAHYFLPNTNKAAEVSVGFPFTKAKALPIGITNDHYGGKKYINDNAYPDIFYVSTNVYTGNAGFIKAGGDDKMACLSEMNIIKNILAKINKKILYKAYPTQKYLDPDPCYNEVLEHKNLKIYLEDKDLRYLSKYAKILVTSKATSTFNWCFLTEKPLIFFNHPHLAPLRKELVPVFENMLFYFDLDKENVESEVIELLNKPVEDITRLYNTNEKITARKEFITEYYFSEKKWAEKRAYEIVKQKAFHE